MADVQVVHDGDGWVTPLTDGDLVLLDEDSIDDVAQRIVFALMVWLGESVYDRAKGVPYLQGVFADEPVPGVAALFSRIVLDVAGVADFAEEPVFDLGSDRTLTVDLKVITTTGQLVELGLEIA